MRSARTCLKNSHHAYRAAFAVLLLSASTSARQAPGGPASASVADVTSMDIEALMNIDVTTASRFAEKLSDAPGIMSVVTSDELRRFGGMTLGEVLQRVPGLTGATQYFADRSMVAARGDQTKTAGGHILFLINGRPTREVQEGGIISDLLESFPVEILDRIEVIRGPGSVSYGSNAFSAVVNLITVKAQSNRVAAKMMGGAAEALYSSTQIAYKRGNLGLVGAGQFHEAPDWTATYQVALIQRDLSFAPQVPNTQYVTMVDRGAGGYLGLDYKGFSFMSAFTEWQTTGFVEGTVSKTHMTRAFGDLGYEHQARANWDMKFDATFTRTTFSAREFPSVARDSREFIAEWTNLITLSSKDTLSAGVLFSRIDGEEDLTSVTPILPVAQGGRSGGAFYGQIEHQLRRDIKLVGGFQTNKIGDLALDTVPRGGVIWTPAPWVSVKALYGQAFRAPALDETLLKHPGLRGNPNLLPEKVATTDLGLSFQKNRIEGGVDYFHSRQTNSILSVNGNPSFFANSGPVTFDGFEMEGKYHFQKDFFAQGSVLYQTNTDPNGVVPNWSYKAGFSYEGRNGLTASLFEVADGVSNSQTLIGAVNPVQGWHNILNGELRYDLGKVLYLPDRTGIALEAHANNLADYQVWLPSGNGSVDTVPVQQGRVVYVGLTFSAGKK